MEPQVNDQAQVDPSGQPQEPVETLPSDIPVEKTPEEIIEELKAERDRYKKDHSELEKLMGRKAQESDSANKEAQKALEQAERQNTRDEYIKSIVDKVVESGMTIDEEIQSKLTELEIAPEIVKLKAYEYKEKIDSVVKVFGSREAYDSALEYGAELGYSQERLAAEGLKALAEKRQPANNEPQQRIAGVSTPVAPQRGYTSLEEYSRDKAKAGNNANMIRMLQEKADRTDWSKLGVVL